MVASAQNRVGPLVENARNSVGDLPSAHLAFMKSGQFSPSSNPLGCGKPDVIDEENTVDLSQASESAQERKEKSRSKSNPKPRRGGSSVASDDFGAKQLI